MEIPTNTEIDARTSVQEVEPLMVSDLRHPAVEGLKRVLREEALQELLDPAALPVTGPPDPNYHPTSFPNYEYARDSGLLDQFYYDPATGDDGIMHTLVGDTRLDLETGAKEVAGFHHEPSASDRSTYVDRSGISQKPDKHKVQYNELPFEPYRAEVVVKGYAKQVFQKNKEGKIEAVKAGSSMFPREYDVLAVLQAARIARDTRDRSLDTPGRNGTVIATGEVPMLDGAASMKLRLILSKDNERVMTAFPLVPRRPGSMNLTQEEITRHLGL